MLFAVGITSLSDFVKNRSHRPYFTLAIGTGYLILYSIVTDPGAGKRQIAREFGKVPYVEYQRDNELWRVHENGKMTRELVGAVDPPTAGGR